MSSESKQGKSVDEISIKYPLIELHPLVPEFILVAGWWSAKKYNERHFQYFPAVLAAFLCCWYYWSRDKVQGVTVQMARKLLQSWDTLSLICLYSAQVKVGIEMVWAWKEKRSRCILGHEASTEENWPGLFLSLSSCQPSFSIVVYSNTGSFLFLSGIVDIRWVYNRVIWGQEMDDQSKDFEVW